MSLPVPKLCHKPSVEHDDLSFFRTLYHTSVKDILEMDSSRIQTLMTRTEALGRWLEGIHKLALILQEKGN
jgi:hypothetical protein